MWRASVPDPIDVARFRKVRNDSDLKPLVIHSNYLVNLASLEPEVRANSIASFRGELERAATIGAEFLVLHPGNYKGQSRDEGLAAFVLGLADSARGLNRSVTVLLENTVGAGCQLGGNFEELRALRELAAGETDLRIGYCLDTCHLLASGFDVVSEDGVNATVAHADRILGIRHVRVIHANDSKSPCNSHIDRHANIGEGFIGEEGFRRILNHPLLRRNPFILETPVDEEGDDRRNLEKLKALSLKFSRS